MAEIPQILPSEWVDIFCLSTSKLLRSGTGEFNNNLVFNDWAQITVDPDHVVNDPDRSDNIKRTGTIEPKKYFYDWPPIKGVSP
jgi:hypothetical protein